MKTIVPKGIPSGIIILTLGLILLTACNKDNPVSSMEATDEEAIFNVVISDNLRLSDMTILSTTIPDTLAFMENPDQDNPLYWHVIDTTIENFQVNIANDPVEINIGLVYEASVYYTKNWQGTFEIMNYNSSADSLERYSKDFSMTGSRMARCQQWGLTSRRRGWILTEISDAHFTAGGQEFLRNLYYHSESNDDSTFVTSIKETGDIPRFDADEELTITFNIPHETDIVYVFLPIDNYSYQLVTPQLIAGNAYQVVATIPSISRIYGQLRFLVVGASSFTGSYTANGFSYNYRVQ